MADITVVTNGRTSLTNAYLELSRLLRRAGHQVTFVTGEAMAPRLAEQGEVVVAVDHDRRYGQLAAADPPPSPARPLALVRWIGRRRRLRQRSIEDRALVEAVTAADPDLVIIDAEFQVALVATATLEVPRVMAMTFFSIFRSPGLPPLSSGLGAAPPSSLRGRAGLVAAWWWNRLGGIGARLRRRLSRPGLAALVRPMPLDSNDLADLRPLATRCGVNLRDITDRSHWLRPHLIRDLPVLCGNVAEMDLPHQRSPRLDYLGPLIRADRREPALAGDELAWWEGLMAARQGAEGPARPLVYATLGTFWSADQDLLQRVIATFRIRHDWDLVIGLGGSMDPDDLGPLPPNVVAVAWAPQLQILAEADVVISHGGSSTLREAVAHGVPLVVYSTGHVDQDGNARRVSHHRLGVVGDPRSDSPADIEAAVSRALDDPAIADGIAEMAEIFTRYRTEGRAVAVIEAHLTGATPAVPTASREG